MNDIDTTDNFGAGSESALRSSSAERTSATRFMEEVNSYRASSITDFAGLTCPRQPSGNEVPVMKVMETTRGCDFEKLDKVGKDTGILNIPDLWKTASDSTARVVLHARKGTEEGVTQGTAVAIGKTADQCVVATARHVVEPSNMTILNKAVEMNDGEFYRADVKIVDNVNDRAILTVKTGAKTDELCHPVKAGESVMNTGNAIITGYPEHSKAKHLSPAKVESVNEAPAFSDKVKTKALEITTQSHTKKGNSGSPMFDSDGNLRGLVTRGPRDYRHENEVSLVTPVTAADQRRWMEQIRKSK